MEPLFFGARDRQLYGVYHSPAGMQYSQQGVVLCYPHGQEYMRTHRAFRQLAMLLAESGYHVLRFDYSGTGDSYGSQENMLFSEWLEDAAYAAEELQAISGINNLSVVGARLGSVVAANLAAKVSASKLVLWEPCSQPEELFDQIRKEIKSAPSQSNFVEDNGGLNFNGFYLSNKFMDDCSKFDLDDIVWSQSHASVLIVTAEDSETVDLVKKKIATKSKNITDKVVDCVSDWNKLDELGGMFLPQKTLTVIVDWLKGAE